jgi:hypothetical protein
MNVQEFPTAVLELSPGLLGLYGDWHCHDEAVLSCQLPGSFLRTHPEASTELNSTCRIHVSTTLLEMT